MFDSFLLGVALTVGQSTPMDPPELPRHISIPNVNKDVESELTKPAFKAVGKPTADTGDRPLADTSVKPAQAVEARPMPPAARPMPLPSVTVPGRASIGDDAPVRTPAALPTFDAGPAPRALPGRIPVLPVLQGTPAPATAAPAAAAPAAEGNGNGGCANGGCEEKKEEEKGHFMALLEGTRLGCCLDRSKISISGWTAGSYTTASSSSSRTNLPVTWNDRKNSFLLQQHWVDIQRAIDTESKEMDWGFRVAFLAGTDYRYTVVRGLFDRQLRTNTPDLNETNGFRQNLYGVDLPLFYGSIWVPGLGGEGTEINIGRMFTPFGYESVMAPTTPLMSRSYAFNWAPPFFHTGVMATTIVNKNITVKNAGVNGNDVFFDGSDEWRYVGQLVLTNDDGSQSLAFGTSLGRGKFNAARPTPVDQRTLGLAFEPAGRNNMNVFDVVYSNKLCDSFQYAIEGIYGYQTSVPAAATGDPGNFGGNTGTASWWAVANYFTYNWSDQLSSILRFEVFQDIHGQRTGFEGTYYATTFGVQYKLMDSVILRPEVRYDYNRDNRPFAGRNGIFVAGSDLIIKW